MKKENQIEDIEARYSRIINIKSEIKKLNKFVGAFDPDTNDKQIYDKMLSEVIRKAQLSQRQEDLKNFVEFLEKGIVQMEDDIKYCEEHQECDNSFERVINYIKSRIERKQQKLAELKSELKSEVGNG